MRSTNNLSASLRELVKTNPDMPRDDVAAMFPDVPATSVFSSWSRARSAAGHARGYERLHERKPTPARNKKHADTIRLHAKLSQFSVEELVSLILQCEDERPTQVIADLLS